MPSPPAWAETFAKIADDIRNNRPPPSPHADPNGLANVLTHINAALPGVILFLQAHQGLETGLADLLAAMDEYGIPHAGELRDALLAAPGLLGNLEKHLPTVLWWMNAFAPAPTGIVGG